MTRRLFLQAACAVTATALCATPALAQEPNWPTRPLRIIVPFGSGSGNDIVARLVGEHLTRALGQPVVVDNRAGGNGTIGADAAARAAPDGYTLFVTTNTTQAAAPSLMKKINYDPVKDFAPIGRIANTPAMLVVHPSLPVKTVAELIALAKARPGKLTYASGSAGTLVPGAMLTSMAGIDMLHVPYKSIPLGINDVIAGQVDMMFTDMATGTPQVKGGKLRALGVSSLTPVPALPDVPPIAQSIKGFELLAWYAMYAPAGTPAPVVERLNRELRAFVGNPATQERMTTLGLQPVTSTPQELADFGRSELAKWTRLIQQAGIQPE
ncbi:MAG: tripartite tricarboxylate transporter substrate binding protein [Hydrogenophaga sp.]|jgi:tripartite-type tricarboxylate transporter receptor subunit TctC|uniref:Bug family tripartite tricarboxylate transporter substrate binding protein n=1 Tax=Hydrogenophaga sp. TaxID=1904254 RepID=UPI001DCF6203|nr:tripartite tricarboxylate transporter substrate-binding protein [Hydrogenophaga sp.]MBW0171702.1 tripartite tricarboxylate transporter substrate binding protein [Hydrogenophaga sp.]MBW0184002.1 tripartite tricarboxylate transporter substrate binding protein [Hydrogenophaga sp.]